jgi:hypothetical protein
MQLVRKEDLEMAPGAWHGGCSSLFAPMRKKVDSRSDELGALIAAEARLEQLVADARADAASRLERARLRAESEESALRARIDVEIEHVTVDIEAATDARIESARAESERLVARYHAVVGPELERVARAIADQMIAVITGGEP